MYTGACTLEILGDHGDEWLFSMFLKQSCFLMVSRILAFNLTPLFRINGMKITTLTGIRKIDTHYSPPFLSSIKTLSSIFFWVRKLASTASYFSPKLFSFPLHDRISLFFTPDLTHCSYLSSLGGRLEASRRLSAFPRARLVLYIILI